MHSQPEQVDEDVIEEIELQYSERERSAHKQNNVAGKRNPVSMLDDGTTKL